LIEYSILENTSVEIKIYNILGQEIKTVLNEFKQSGTYTVEWDGKDKYGQNVSTGIYIYRLNAKNYSEFKKMVYLK
jgi:flagellar hook assembly protein FlgD